MKKSIYLKNIEKSINRQIKWSNFQSIEDKIKFLDEVIAYCEKMKTKETKKSPKTRQG